MKNNGKADCSIKSVEKFLHQLNDNIDLFNPEAVKNWIANHQVSNGTKRNMVLAYSKFCEVAGIPFKKPIYKDNPRPRRIPTKQKIEKLIASASTNLSIKLQLSYETGLRPVELCNLKVRDFDKDTRTILPSTAKYGASRTLRISVSLTARLTKWIQEHQLKLDQRIFYGDSEYYGKQFRQHRNKLASELEDQDLRTIKLYDLRHYFATMLYDKTKDILLVKQQMGHRKIGTTLIYTQLLNITDEEYTCKTASNVKQATELIEAGFEHVADKDGFMLFRKRK